MRLRLALDLKTELQKAFALSVKVTESARAF